MANIPQKPVVNNQQWINGQTKLNSRNLTSGVNQNITNLKTVVDGIIDALGGAGSNPISDLQGDIADLETAKADKENTYSKIETEALLAGKQDALVFDSTPTSGSTNPVTSGGVYAALSGKQDTMTAGAGISIDNGVISVSYANADEEAF